MPEISRRPSILKYFHDNIGHWDVLATKTLVTDCLWWPTGMKGVHDYVKSCGGCEKASKLPKYKTKLSLPVSALFETFSIAFDGPLRITHRGSQYVIVAVKHLSNSFSSKRTRMQLRSVY